MIGKLVKAKVKQIIPYKCATMTSHLFKGTSMHSVMLYSKSPACIVSVIFKSSKTVTYLMERIVMLKPNINNFIISIAINVISGGRSFFSIKRLKLKLIFSLLSFRIILLLVGGRSLLGQVLQSILINSLSSAVTYLEDAMAPRK